MAKVFTSYPRVWVCIALAVCTAAVYAPVRNYGFIVLDDEGYVFQNAHVMQGLTGANVAWAFTSTIVSNWHPLSWLSHLLDVSLFGLRPGPHHVVNVVFHIFNAVGLFLVLDRMTRATWRSAWVAALFALHPLHIESVAWIAERKDVLSTFFWVLAMAGYAAYARRPGWKTYLLVLIPFAVGLLAKPMLVTLPCALLLLDYWPLGRFAPKPGESAVRQAARLAAEKIPLFALALASSVATFLVQAHGGAVQPLDKVPLDARFANALISYARYLGKAICPIRLSIFYPTPQHGWPMGYAAAALVLMAAITLGVFLLRRRRPYLLVGWLWFVGTLVPVIGLVQVGLQAMADRYMYVPAIGLFVMVAWGMTDAAEWIGSRRSKERAEKVRRAFAILAVAMLVLITVATALRLSDWSSSRRLFQNALRFGEDSPYLQMLCADAYKKEGDPDTALRHYRESVRLNPRYADAYFKLGNTLADRKNFAEAAECYAHALESEPDHLDTIVNMGNAMAMLGKLDQAEIYFAKSLELDPNNVDAQINLGNVLVQLKRYGEAQVHFAKAIELQPAHADAQAGLGYALAAQDRLEEAAQAYARAVELNPRNAGARETLARIRAELERRRGQAGSK